MNINSNTTVDDVRKYLANNVFTQKIIQFLLQNASKDDINNIKDMNGYTALMYASLHSNTKSNEETVRKLLEKGANVNYKSDDDETALQLAVISTGNINTSTENTVKILIDAGADVNHRNDEGMTLLMIATAYSNDVSSQKTIKLLLDAGADINASYIPETFEFDFKNMKDVFTKEPAETALSLSAKYIATTSSEKTVQFLIENGGKIIPNDTVKNVYDIIRNVKPESKLLPEHQIKKINVMQTVNFTDPITLEEKNISIKDYIQEDPKHVVIAYNDNTQFFFTSHDIIERQEDNAIVYPCFVSDTIKPENVHEDEPLYDLKKIGFVNSYPCNIEILYENPKHQLFFIINTNIKYPSFISDNVFRQGGSFISGLHCQSGQESKISIMGKAEPLSSSTAIRGGYKKRTYKSKHIRKDVNKTKTSKSIKKQKRKHIKQNKKTRSKHKRKILHKTKKQK